MNRGQQARLTSLQRVQVYLDENAASLGAVSRSTSRTDLDTAVTALQGYVAQQAHAEQEAQSRRVEKEQAREDLRINHLQPIAAIARKKLTGTPAMQAFGLPHKNTSDINLIAMGKAMAQAAVQYEQVFVDQQLPADFLAQLTASVQAVQDAVNAQSAAKLRVNDATKSVKSQLSITTTDVKVLHGLVTKQLKDKPGLLGAWKNAKRVHVVGVVSTAPATDAPAPAAGTA